MHRFLATPTLYQADFYAWTQVQAKLLRNQQWDQIDLANLIEEIESLGKQQCQELRNRLSLLIGHLLKWQYQPQRRSRSWLATLSIQRKDCPYSLVAIFDPAFYPGEPSQLIEELLESDQDK